MNFKSWNSPFTLLVLLLTPWLSADEADAPPEMVSPAEWKVRLTELRRDLDEKDEVAASEATLAIAEIGDPNAIGALRDMLACEKDFKVRCLLVVPLARMRSLGLKPTVEESFETMSAAEWRGHLAELRKALDGEDAAAAEAARLEICRVRDPNAFGVVKQMLLRDKDFEVRRLFTAPLARTGGDDALGMLADMAVRDDLLKGEAALALALLDNGRDALPIVAKYLHNRRYQAQAVETLAIAQLIKPLEQDQKPDQQLTTGLIDALALKSMSRRQVPGLVLVGGGSAQGLHSPPESWRRARLRTFTVHVVMREPNSIARELLENYASTDHGFDQQAWTNWYRQESKTRKAVREE